jgi:hypothetical protein
MPTYLKPSYPNLDAIPEAQRDFYVLVDSEYQLAQESGEIAAFFNKQLAAKKSQLQGEKDALKRESDRQGREITRLTEAAERIRTNREQDVSRLTEELQHAEEELRKHQTAGNVVITKEEAALFDRVKKLGKPEDVAAGKLDLIVAEVEAGMNERGTLRAENVKNKLDLVTREASDLTGFNFDALRTVLTHPELSKDVALVVKSVKDKDDTSKQVRKAFVVTKDDKDKEIEVALDEYAAEHWTAFMPALEAESENGGGERGTKLTRQRPSSGRSGDDDDGKGKTKIDKIVAGFQAERDRAPNALSPPKADK